MGIMEQSLSAFDWILYKSVNQQINRKVRLGTVMDLKHKYFRFHYTRYPKTFLQSNILKTNQLTSIKSGNYKKQKVLPAYIHYKKTSGSCPIFDARASNVIFSNRTTDYIFGHTFQTQIQTYHLSVSFCTIMNSRYLLS